MSGPTQSPEIAAALLAVRNWMRRKGELPTDQQFVQACSAMVDEWREQRADCLDILASAALDELAETVQAMKDDV